ncbi:MAG TPA: hypothetical protein PKC43_04065 [Phycisphaerales bacterium]|nr:hypothetical protein [Phycisphaerales bacterium]HMP36602.1 hypothetical protein [Phycisphaerales bacterium]
MQLETDMRMQMDGKVEMHMHMQGPSVAYSGTFISEALLGRLEVGKTRSDWVLAVFGEPTDRAALDDGSEIWKWAYLPVRQQGAVITVLSTGGGKEEPRIQSSTTFVHIREGVVAEAWRD